MHTCTLPYPSYMHGLNNALSEAGYSDLTMKSFNNLIIPPGFHFKKENHNPSIYICNKNEDSKCIDNKLFNKLITLAEPNIHKKSKTKKTAYKSNKYKSRKNRSK